MTMIGPSFFILGLVVASVTADETSTLAMNITSSIESEIAMHNDDNTTSVTVSTNTTMNSMVVNNISSTMNSSSSAVSTMHTPTITSAIRPSTKVVERTTTTHISYTPKPIAPTPSTPNPKEKGKTEHKPTAKPQEDSSDRIGIIILVVIILVILGTGITCFIARKRGRRYSVDFASRPDETNIPLSAVEPELPADTVSQNGLQTFADIPTKELEGPEEKPEAQEEQKAEADKSKTEADPSAESAAPAPAPSPSTSEEKPKEDVVEQTPPAPVEPNAEEKTDDEGAVSNKTSEESLKETNENNSNNADVSQQRDLVSSKLFWDVPLNCPV